MACTFSSLRPQPSATAIGVVVALALGLTLLAGVASLWRALGQSAATALRSP